jgi:LmbE family N-acetylglucosaminyl deacetylase
MKQKTIIFVFAHQDDEILISGKIMSELALGSSVHLVWCNDGSGGTGLYASYEEMVKDYSTYLLPNEDFDSLSQARIKEILCIVRENEARSAMESIGIKSGNMIFLKHAADWMKKPENILLLIDELRAIFAKINPDEIYCDAWEGAHVTHDITHFAAVHAVHELTEPRPDIFEFPQYPLLKSYKISLLKHLKKTKITDTVIHLLHYGIGQFADEQGKTETLHLSQEQVKIKSRLMRYYVSQSKLTSDFNSILKARATLGIFLPHLKHMPDIEMWRTVPVSRDYNVVPCKGHRYSEYNQGISAADYKRILGTVLESMKLKHWAR